MNQIKILRAELKKLTLGKVDETLIRAKEKELDDEIARVLADEKTSASDLKDANDLIVELKRQSEISDIARAYGSEVEEETLTKFLTDPTKTPLDFSRSLLEVKKEEQVDVPFGRAAEKADIHRAMGDALVLRAGVNLKNAHTQAKDYLAIGLKDLARSITGYQGYNDNEMVQRAMSTSDFPVLLGNVANRILSHSFEVSPAERFILFNLVFSSFSIESSLYLLRFSSVYLLRILS